MRASAAHTGACGDPTCPSANGARCARTTARRHAWDYLPHDHARSRAYRWGEDGIAGICDDQQQLCFALALWNGADPILKERMFGLTGNEGNHGEDVKEYYFYLDNVPSHAYMKYLYKYPQRAFPYADLVRENARRTRADPEYELLDTGTFDDDRYFDVQVEYAKASPQGHPGARPGDQSRRGGRAAASASHAVVQERLVVERRSQQAAHLDRRRRGRHDRAARGPSHASCLFAVLRAAARGTVHRERIQRAAPVERAQRAAVREGCVPRIRRRRQARRGESRACRDQGVAPLRSRPSGPARP
jgi:hypothetical protein